MSTKSRWSKKLGCCRRTKQYSSKSVGSIENWPRTRFIREIFFTRIVNRRARGRGNRVEEQQYTSVQLSDERANMGRTVFIFAYGCSEISGTHTGCISIMCTYFTAQRNYLPTKVAPIRSIIKRTSYIMRGRRRGVVRTRTEWFATRCKCTSRHNTKCLVIGVCIIRVRCSWYLTSPSTHHFSLRESLKKHRGRKKKKNTDPFPHG